MFALLSSPPCCEECNSDSDLFVLAIQSAERVRISERILKIHIWVIDIKREKKTKEQLMQTFQINEPFSWKFSWDSNEGTESNPKTP